jgi:hypothetical protein
MLKSLPLALMVILAGPSQPSALQQFKDLQQQQGAAKKSGDQGKIIRLALQVQSLLNNAPDAILDTAESYAAAGDAKNALAALEQFAELGQVDDTVVHGENKTFSALHKDPRFQSILTEFSANQVPITTSETAFVVSDPGLLAEDIDYDPATHTFLISSVLEKKIVRLTLAGRITDFAHSPTGWPILALKIDAQRGLVWATEVAMNDW